MSGEVLLWVLFGLLGLLIIAILIDHDLLVGVIIFSIFLYIFNNYIGPLIFQ